ncbi:acyl-CoA dehydrogenase family protein [Microbacterium sp. No. 7]|uniref:acyl-CoA dehydrogenase family protein n=1 Tax=Microbacterium sp. No. 7 TaxID=1714373 RepID=UPI0006D24631|nr:acyl-CoA dehydrogenase family protein [Microbacterium sp. No. 7]ALJ21191.1 hypothetical protein AOA12_15290 [Microbacterium sp. No. 7]
MDLGFTEEQEAVREAVQQIMEGPASQETLIRIQFNETGFVPEIWEALIEGGWTGIAVPDEFGGTGASLSEAAVVFEEFGAGPLPQIFAVALSISPLLVLELGTDEQKADLLGRMVEGEIRATVAVNERGSSWAARDLQTVLTPTAGGFTLSGEKMNVLDALGATHAFVAARRADTGELAIVLVDLSAPGVQAERLDGFTSWENRLVLDGVAIDASAVLGEGDAREGFDRATLQAVPLIASYQVGSAHAAYKLALEYSRTRVQFGQLIGRFQRVQDHVIEAINAVDSARWLTYELVWRMENDKPGIRAAQHVTKWVTAESHWTACIFSHETHAGVGADMQYGLAKHTYLSHSLLHLLGSPAQHREQFAEAMGW